MYAIRSYYDFSSLEEAQQKISPLNLSVQAKAMWNAVLQALINADDDDGLSADHIAEDAAHYLPKSTTPEKITDTSQIMRILTQMADIGLISKGLLLTVITSYSIHYTKLYDNDKHRRSDEYSVKIAA